MQEQHDKPAAAAVGLNVYPSGEALSRAAAELFARIATAAVAEQGLCAVALTGGSSPCGLYRLLAENPYRHLLPWDRVHLFWGDERCVPPDHPDSNFLMAQTTLLGGISIPDANVHRMRGEDDPARAAQEYDEVLRDYFEPSPGRFPRFDLVLLGLGDDGHVASLFPNGLELGESERFAIETQKPGGWRRISLTLPTINAARNVVFLVRAASKAGILPRAMGEPDRNVPGSLVRPVAGDLYWLVAKEAAALVQGKTDGETG
jgi:6-phosphogluconolactonase